MALTGPGLGILISFIAAAATIIGVIPIIFIKKFKVIWLAGSLGIAAGVMIVLPLWEIWEKTVEKYEESGQSEDLAQVYGGLTILLGVTINVLIDLLVHFLLRKNAKSPALSKFVQNGTLVMPNGKKTNEVTDQVGKETTNLEDGLYPEGVEMSPNCIAGEVGEDNTYQANTYQDNMYQDNKESPSEQKATTETMSTWNQELDAEKRKPLWIEGLLNGIAVSIHNFPEGMVTFAGAMSDPVLGILLAVGIALHNIPEGVAISVPIYYSTESKLKALGWTMLSAAAELAGAFLAWAIIASSSMNALSLALLFGITVGVMIHIAIVKMIPACFRFDQKAVITPWSIMLGMFIMAVAIIILHIAGHSHGGGDDPHAGHNH